MTTDVNDAAGRIAARIQRFIDTARERFERNIHPTEGDRAWFERNRRSKNSWPRRYRVRETIPSDHWLFKIGEKSPKGFITIISRDPPITMALVQAAEETFGPVVDSDEYARMRWDNLQKEHEQSGDKSVPV